MDRRDFLASSITLALASALHAQAEAVAPNAREHDVVHHRQGGDRQVDLFRQDLIGHFAHQRGLPLDIQ